MRLAATVVALTLPVAACTGEDVQGAVPDPSPACDEALAAAASQGGRPAPATPVSPDIDTLVASLEACSSSRDWLAGARAHPESLPMELDRETALDLLCAEHGGTSACRGWEPGGEADQDRPGGEAP